MLAGSGEINERLNPQENLQLNGWSLMKFTEIVHVNRTMSSSGHDEWLHLDEVSLGVWSSGERPKRQNSPRATHV